MSEKTAARTRQKWVDDVKVIACILNSRLKYTYRTKQFKEMPFKK